MVPVQCSKVVGKYIKLLNQQREHILSEDRPHSKMNTKHAKRWSVQRITSISSLTWRWGTSEQLSFHNEQLSFHKTHLQMSEFDAALAGGLGVFRVVMVILIIENLVHLWGSAGGCRCVQVCAGEWRALGFSQTVIHWLDDYKQELGVGEDNSLCLTTFTEEVLQSPPGITQAELTVTLCGSYTTRPGKWWGWWSGEVSFTPWGTSYLLAHLPTCKCE